MGKEVVSDYEFVKVNDHKSHLLMNVLNMDALCTEMTSDKLRSGIKLIAAKIPFMELSLLIKNEYSYRFHFYLYF